MDVRRVVTGHDEAGRAIVLIDGPCTRRAPGFSSIRVWSGETLPANNDGDKDQGQHDVGFDIKGSAFRMLEMAPGWRSPMHRTSSLDYAVVIKGEVELELDDGVTTILKAGDVAVQRGTMHAWNNLSAEPALIAFVLIKADPAKVGAKVLEAVHP